MELLAVAAGGATGSVLRYLIGRALDGAAAAFPWSTLLVNVIGCGLLGFLGATLGTRWQVSPEFRAMLSIGVLGGFTTFSTFGHQTAVLWRDGAVGAALANVALNLFLGLAAAAVGWRLGRGL